MGDTSPRGKGRGEGDECYPKEKEKGSKKDAGNGKRRARGKNLTYEERLRAVKMYLEEGRPVRQIAKELGCYKDTVYKWSHLYRTHGEAGFRERGRLKQAKVSPQVKTAIEEVKRKNPGFGVRTISHFLSRFLFLRASRETVRKTLKEQELLSAPQRKKPKRNPKKPRFFERATPNQLWQSDILTFRLGGTWRI